MTKTFLKLVWWQQVIIIAVVSICYMQLAGLVGTQVLVPAIDWSSGVGAVGDPSNADSIFSRFARWDSGYYLQIAENGYRPQGTEIAFFPLYSLLTHVVSTASGLSLLAVGWALSVLSLICACLFMYKWVLIDYPHPVALLAVIWVCCFPMAFFLTAFYPEALFLALSVASMYFARRGQFIASGAAIAFAGATRPFGFLLAIPFFLEFWLQRNFSPVQFIKLLMGALLAPLGALSFLLYLGQIGNNTNFLSVYFSNQSDEWKRSFALPWVTLYDGINAALFGTRINADWFSRASVVQDLAYAGLGLAGAIYSLRVLRPSAAWFLVIGMIFIYTNHGVDGYAFWSVPRFVLTLFPFYLLLALLTLKLPVAARWALVLVSLGMQGLLAAWFASGRWVA